MLRNSAKHYGLPARAFHWLSALAVFAALACIELTDLFPRGSAGRLQLFLWHINAGVLTGLLVLPRLLWRAGNRPPAITPPLSPPMQYLSHMGHGLLYGLMVLLPLLGVLAQQSGGKVVSFLSWPLPILVGSLPQWHHDLREAHELAGNLLIVVLVLHVAAALWHHFILRDDTLTRLTGRRT